MNASDLGVRGFIYKLRFLLTDGARFERPENFDLALYWKEWQGNFLQTFSPITVSLRAALVDINTLVRVFGEGIYRLVEQPEMAGDGDRVTLQLQFESLDAAQRALLGFGAAVEVLFPLELRDQLQKAASSVVILYSPS